MKRLAPALALLVSAACNTADHPGGPTSTETELLTYQSCDALENDLKDMLYEEIEAQFDQERYWQTHPGGILEDGAGGPTPTTSTPRQEGVDYSGTNNQEQGVDEADIVKTDGFHIYVLNGNRLHIYGVPQFGQLAAESVVEIEGYPTQLLLDKESGRVAVFSYVDPTTLPEAHPLRARVGERDSRGVWLWRMNQVSKITVIEAGNRLAPGVGREIWLEGSYQTARLVERTVRVGSYSYLDVPEVRAYFWGWYGTQLDIDQRQAAAKAAVARLHLEDLVPRIYERLPDKRFNSYSITGDGCRSFHRPTDSQSRGVTSIVSFDLSANDFRFDADHVVTNWSNLYASTDRLYISEAAHDWWWFWWNERDDDVTNVHAFDISSAGKTTYLGSGRVRGRIENSFSMGEEGGLLRVATTTDRFARWWLVADERPQSESHVFVLAQEGRRLAAIGHLGGIAPGERIFSARFVGDRAFLVTFKNIDPLFTIDLSVPTSPRILGKLKVPGVSTYIHPLEDGKLITIGYGGDQQMLNWRPQVSLFDVSDEEHPALLDTQQLAGGPDNYAWSEALYEHKAFQYWAPKGLLAVPVSSYRSSGDSRGWTWTYSSHLVLVSVGASGLSLYGDIDHSRFYNSAGDRQWVYTDVRRSIFMGDFIYAISDRGITVHRLDNLQLVAEQQLPGYTPYAYYWWW